MKKILAIISSGLMGAALALPASAQDDSPRFSDEGFLEEWNTFLEREKNAARSDQLDFNVDLGLQDDSGSSDQEKGFLYFKDNKDREEDPNTIEITAESPVLRENGLTSFTPRSFLLSEDMTEIGVANDSKILGDFTPRQADAYVRLGLGKREVEGEFVSKFDVTIDSAIFTRQADLFNAMDTSLFGNPLNSQVYRFGFNVDYSGINFGASIQGEESAYFDGLSGLNVGLSYQQPSWSTSVLVSQYRQTASNLIGLNNPLMNEQFYSVEFGAAYKITPWFKFVGTFRLYEDANLMLLDPASLSGTRMLYLGTNLNF